MGNTTGGGATVSHAEAFGPIEAAIRLLASEWRWSFADTMRFLSTRDSLTIAGELLGGVGARQLGDYLSSRGYFGRVRGEKPENRQEEASKLAQHTKEEYRALLAEGLTQDQIAAQWGIKKNSLIVMASSKGWNKPDSENPPAPSTADALARQLGQALAPEGSASPEETALTTEPLMAASEQEGAEDPVEVSQTDAPVEPVAWATDPVMPGMPDVAGPSRIVSDSTPFVNLGVECPRCGGRHMVAFEELLNAEPDAWWGTYPDTQQPVWAYMQVTCH